MKTRTLSPNYTDGRFRIKNGHEKSVGKIMVISSCRQEANRRQSHVPFLFFLVVVEGEGGKVGGDGAEEGRKKKFIPAPDRGNEFIKPENTLHYTLLLPSSLFQGQTRQTDKLAGKQQDIY